MSSALPLPRLTYRELPPEEIHRLSKYEPFKAQGGLPAEVNQGVARAIVAEEGGEGGEIVAFWFIHAAVHVEPLWVAEEHRGALVVGRLWELVVDTLRRAEVPIAYAVIDDDAPHLAPAKRLGFTRLGTIYGVSPWNPTRGDAERKEG